MKLHFRLVTTVIVSTLCALSLIASPGQAAVKSSATDAGSWLAGQLTGGLINSYSDFGNYDDYGLTIDVFTAIHTADVEHRAQSTIMAALEKNTLNYISFVGDNAGKARYAGAAAKLLVAVQAAGKNSGSFGGVDLVATVEKSVTATGQIADRDSDFGDFANMLGESFALQGLAAADSAKTVAVRDFVIGQQCSGGNFPLYFGDCSSPDVDATAAVLTALSTATSEGVGGLKPAIAKGVAWLVARQKPDGSFGGGTLTSVGNTNSTGLAASVLAKNGHLAEAREAAAWTSALQADSSRGARLAKDTGAIAYSRSGFVAAKSNGITNIARGEWRRATAQAILGLVYFDRSVLHDTKIITKTLRPKPIVRTVTGATAVAPVAPGVAAEAVTPAGRLGQYLSRQFTNGDHIEVKKGSDRFVDYDLTARAVLGLRQLSEQGALATRTTKFLFDQESIAAYAHGAPYEKSASYAGPLAKLIIVGSVAQKTDPKLLKSLVDELSGLQQADGSFKDKGKYADRIGDPQRQVFAAIALRMAGDSAGADRAVSFIEKSQCDNGGFGTSFGVVCTTSDPAATGWALQALGAVEAINLPASATLATLPIGWDADRMTTIESAARSLQSDVHIDGSVDAADGSASIPVTAVVAAGRQAAGLDTRAAARFVASHQLSNGGLGNVKSDLDISLAAAPALGANSLLTLPGSNLSGGITFPLAATAGAGASAPAVAKKSGTDVSISRPAAYAGGGALGVLVLVSLGIGVAGLARKRGSA